MKVVDRASNFVWDRVALTNSNQEREVLQMLLSVKQRIERVITNLLPAATLEGKFSSPKTLSEQLARYDTPGISIAVINDFEIEWAQGFGICEAKTTRGVTAETLFQAGSISKPVFALAVMRLVQEGHLDLDEDVNPISPLGVCLATEIGNRASHFDNC